MRDTFDFSLAGRTLKSLRCMGCRSCGVETTSASAIQAADALLSKVVAGDTGRTGL